MSIATFAQALPHGITLQCRRSGAAGAKPRVVFLHGFPEAAFAWDEVMGLLGPGLPCVAPNQRGYAGSSAPAELSAYRARHLVADLVALLDSQLGPGEPLDLLVAHDWGGAVAWNLAAQMPQRLNKLLIINSPHPATFLRELRDDAAHQQASAYMNFLCRPDAAALLAENSYARLWPFFGPTLWLSDALRASYREVWDQGLDGALNWYRASPLRPPTAATDPIHSLRFADADVTVAVPTTVLWGEQDIALLPGLLHGLERWVPQLDLRRVSEASHWLVHEQPQRVAAVVHELLES